MRRELPSVALLIDYDNLEIGASYDLPGRALDLGCMIELCQRYGTVVVARAYADWGDPNERLAVYESGIEPCFAPIFRTTADQPGKSLADTVLVADGVDILWRIAPEFLVLVTSDKDILPLARLARLRGTRTIVVGSDRTAVPLRRLADEYVTYRDLVMGTGIPVATHQRAGLVPLSRGQSEPRGPRLLPEPRATPAAAPRTSTRRPPTPRGAVPPSAPPPAPVAEMLPAASPQGGRLPAEGTAPAEDGGAAAAGDATSASRRRRRRRGGSGRGAGAGEPGIMAATGALELQESLAEESDTEVEGAGELAAAQGEVLAEAAGAGASVLERDEAAAPSTAAPDAEALEEEVAPPPLPSSLVSPTGRMGFASFGSFGSFEEPPRAVEPEPIAPTAADRAVASVGPVEVPPLEAAIEAPPAEAEGEATPEAAAADEPAAGEAPTAAPARRRTRAPGRGRRARDQADADAVATEGTPT
ncbi:MAG TPA: NYN domain-containing protein [Chloroflexota bacterium]|jgi:hypothetical protein